MAIQDFIDFVKEESLDLVNGFRKACILGKGTPQEISDFRENYFKGFVARYFPFPHRITKGKIRDSHSNISASIDCIVINPNHPYTIDNQKKFNIILADGVDLAIEVKPDISSASELHRGLKQIQSVKRLQRREGPLWFKNTYPVDVVDYSKRIPSFIFAMKAKSNIIDTFRDIQGYYQKFNVPLNEQVDFVVVNDIGIISNYKCEKYSIAVDLTTTKKLTGFFFEEWKELTTVGFILWMNNVPHACNILQENILNYYMGDLLPYSITKL